ncbi:ABC transporter permease subunit [Cohnella hongkongensis]|uniref:ABC transporter permease subunit n=1 Tax=Cohnella hongkongensis TaxID=178337 RepID=A0ABV9FFQ9_9BACL
MKKNRTLRTFKKNAELFTLSFPSMLYIFIMAYVPMFGIIIAFKNYQYDKGMFGSEWIGWKNFEFLFVSDTAYRITRNTVLYNLGYLALTTLCALALAILLNEIAKKWLKIYQTALILPFFLSWVVVGYIALAFLDHENGYLNEWLSAFGMEPKEWYFSAVHWPYILVAVHLWKSIGLSAMVYYAGILGIDGEMYEAAKIDGASKLQMIVKITLPHLTSLIIILFILGLGNIFRGDFGLHYFIPNNSGMTYATTDVIDTYVYRALSKVGDVGMASAVGLYQSIVGLVTVVLANYAVRKINEEHSLY